MELKTTVTLTWEEYQELAQSPFTLTLANGSKVCIEVGAKPEVATVLVDPVNGTPKVTKKRRPVGKSRKSGPTGPISGKVKCWFCPQTFKFYGTRSQHCAKDHPEEWAKRQADRGKKKARGRQPES